MQFKGNSPDLENEFHDDKLLPLVRGCYLDLSRFELRANNKPLVITDIYRSPIRQRNLCEAFKAKSGWRHCIWAAIDFRSRNLNDEEIRELLRYADLNWKKFCRLRYHKKGTARHFHLQANDKHIDINGLWRIIENTDGAESWFAG